jgi:hypothetical protein
MVNSDTSTSASFAARKQHHSLLPALLVRKCSQALRDRDFFPAAARAKSDLLMYARSRRCAARNGMIWTLETAYDVVVG